MKQFLKTYRKLFITLLFPYLYLMFFLIVPTDFSVHAPGGINPVGPIVSIEETKMSDAFYTVFIYHWTPLTAFQRLVFSQDEEMTIYPRTLREKDTSYRDDFLSGQLSKTVSLKSSILLAYQLASEKNQDIKINYAYQGVYIYQRPKRMQELKIGDQVVAANGYNFQDHYEQFQSMLLENDINFTIKREVDGNIVIVNVAYRFEPGDLPIRYLPNYQIIEATPQIDLSFSDFKSGGPSGGLIQTLSIYASLLKLNITDEIIAGTGTVSMDGFVGKIGGIKQKIYTGIYQKIDIFFLPESHYNDIKNIKIPYELVRVSTVREAVEWLYERYN